MNMINRIGKGACVAFALCTTSVFAEDAAQMSETLAEQAQIAELVSMSAADRRATLKSMSQEERNGLWFKVRKAIQNQRANSTDIQPKGGVIVPPTAFNPSIQAVGTISYDSGFASTAFGDGNSLPGNRFDTHTGIPVFTSGTVATVVAQVVRGPANTTSSAGFVLIGETVGADPAPFKAIFSTFGVATGVIDTVSFAGINATYTGNNFTVLFGDFASVYVPVFGTGTTLAQGHHGVDGFTGGMGPNMTSITPLPGLNAFIRASGDIVPVELMNFEVE